MIQKLKYKWWRLKDDARHHPFVRLVAMRCYELKAACLPRNCSGSVNASLNACALASTVEDMRRCAAPIQRLLATQSGRAAALRLRCGLMHESFVAKNPGLSRTIVLKAPGPQGERGVVVTHFEYNWQRLVRGIADFPAFTKEYDVIYTTSWSPPNYGALAMLLAATPEEIMVQPNHPSDAALVRAFHPRVNATKCIVSEWLLPECSAPKAWEARDIDLLYVANWAPFKRHREFFAVLQRLPNTLRVVCVGQPDGRHTLDEVKAMKVSMGVPQDIVFMERLPIDEVTSLQARAKVAVLFSRREGANIAAAEALMAGALLAMRADAHVGSWAYVNEGTGALFSAENAAEVLLDLLTRGAHLNPREWAEAHLSCRHTARLLNEQLSDWSTRRGGVWATDLAVPYWRPYQRFADDADRQRLSEEYRRLHARYPAVFAEDLIDTGHQ